MSRLRACLASLEVSVDDVGGGYRLNGDLVSDAHRFTVLVETARRTRRHGSPAAPRWEDALALWRGDYLEDFDVERLRPGRRQALRELHLAAGVDLARGLLDRDEVDSAVAGLERLVAVHPYNEAAVELLVLALYGRGDRVESLRRLHGFRTRLHEETGLEPGVGLADLESRILADDRGLTPVPRTAVPAGAGPLPRWTTSFVGRAELVAELGTLVGQHHLVSLVGPAGVGKTRLAVEAVSALGQGVEAVFVDLSVVATGSRVDEVVAGALGLAGHAGPEIRAVLVRHLQRVTRLLILDNCEHVVDEVSVLAAEIVRTCPGCRIVATSRERLRIASETILAVEPLAIDGDDPAGSAAMRLLTDRAGPAAVDSRPAQRDAAIELCRSLDGLPLAIELAANRLRTMPVSDLVAQLHHRFALLDTGDRTAPRRHQTLAAAIDWSVDELTASQHSTLVRCSTFVGRFSLADAVAVCADDEARPVDVAAGLADLVDRSLVEFAPVDPPYRLLDTFRQFGRDQLEAEGTTELWRARVG